MKSVMIMQELFNAKQPELVVSASLTVF